MAVQQFIRGRRRRAGGEAEDGVGLARDGVEDDVGGGAGDSGGVGEGLRGEHGRQDTAFRAVLARAVSRRTAAMETPEFLIPVGEPGPPRVVADPRELRVHRAPPERDVPYVPTDEPVVAAMLRFAGVTERDVVYDLGCG